MTSLFLPLPMHDEARSAVDGREPYVSQTSPPGVWPSDYGAPAATSRSGEPLVTERWQLGWQAPLGAAREPDQLLLGEGVILVSGERARRAFTSEGQPLGTLGRAQGACFFDLEGGRLVTHDPEGGLFTYLLPTLRRDGCILLAYPTPHITRTILQGPGVLAFLSVVDTPFGPRPNAVVEVVRVRDWNETGKRKIHYGLEPMAGMIRERDGKVRAAAANAGPVLATPDGIRWCDWQLRTLSEAPLRMNPRALSVDAGGRAHLLCDMNGEAHLLMVSPDSAAVVDVRLPWEVDATFVPPQIGLDGTIFLTPPGLVLILAPDGCIRYWARRGSQAPPGTVTANGMLLVSDRELFALTPEGERHVLWRPPQPLVTPPVLAGGRITVASNTTLYALEMQ